MKEKPITVKDITIDSLENTTPLFEHLLSLSAAVLEVLFFERFLLCYCYINSKCSLFLVILTLERPKGLMVPD